MSGSGHGARRNVIRRWWADCEGAAVTCAVALLIGLAGCTPPAAPGDGQSRVADAAGQENPGGVEPPVLAAPTGQATVAEQGTDMSSVQPQDGGEPVDAGGEDSAEPTDSVGVEEDGQTPEPSPPVGCPPGLVCVDEYPFSDLWSTLDATSDVLDFYSCKPSADESGPEVIYQVSVAQAGFLSAAVYDGEGVDVDVHILSALDEEACLDRGHHHARVDVEPGVYYVVVDTFVDGGMELAGDYQVDIGFTVPSMGPCEMEIGVMKRVGDGGDHLQMPATGPVVMEAHLVTAEEPKPYPTTSTEELLDHYELSQAETGFVMHRDGLWAPLEGGTFYGAGIGSPTAFPVLHEHWYLCMYWTKESRPEKGTRMILQLPGTSRAVVVAAGYETGPGNLDNIGGSCEEPHYYLGTGHKSELTLGIAVDQSIPFGPRVCQ